MAVWLDIADDDVGYGLMRAIFNFGNITDCLTAQIPPNHSSSVVVRYSSTGHA